MQTYRIESNIDNLINQDLILPKYTTWEWLRKDAEWSWINFLVEDIDGLPFRIVETDGGEPEDQCFTRDLDWIPAELNKAYLDGYEQGRIDEQEEIAAMFGIS